VRASRFFRRVPRRPKPVILAGVMTRRTVCRSIHTSAAALVALFALSLAAAWTRAADEQRVPKSHPVLRAAYAFPDGGLYNAKWAGSGTPEEITHNGTRILAKGEGGTYCCGFTFAVVMRVAAEHKLLADKSAEQVKRFQKDWYGAVDEPDVRERQAAVAVERIGVGKTVPFDDATPGDFCQFWRGKSGHSVVFLGWAEQDGKRVGLRYRSSQGSTKGVGDVTEYFTDAKDPDGKPGRVLRDRTYFGRLKLD
jgi:hypothetical protein